MDVFLLNHSIAFLPARPPQLAASFFLAVSATVPFRSHWSLLITPCAGLSRLIIKVFCPKHCGAHNPRDRGLYFWPPRWRPTKRISRETRPCLIISLSIPACAGASFPRYPDPSILGIPESVVRWSMRRAGDWGPPARTACFAATKAPACVGRLGLSQEPNLRARPRSSRARRYKTGRRSFASQRQPYENPQPVDGTGWGELCLLGKRGCRAWPLAAAIQAERSAGVNRVPRQRHANDLASGLGHCRVGVLPFPVQRNFRSRTGRSNTV
jgi:hypothetical protein